MSNTKQKQMRFEIATPERIVCTHEAVIQVTLPTQMGEITVLPNHIPLIANLVSGEITVKTTTEEIYMACSGGFIQVTPYRIVVLADTAERVEELVLEEIEKARERAVQLVKEKHKDEVASASAVAALERELARYRVVIKRKGHRPTKTIHMEQK